METSTKENITFLEFIGLTHTITQSITFTSRFDIEFYSVNMIVTPNQKVRLTQILPFIYKNIVLCKRWFENIHQYIYSDETKLRNVH